MVPNWEQFCPEEITFGGCSLGGWGRGDGEGWLGNNDSYWLEDRNAAKHCCTCVFCLQQNTHWQAGQLEITLQLVTWERVLQSVTPPTWL